MRASRLIAGANESARFRRAGLGRRALGYGAGLVVVVLSGCGVGGSSSPGSTRLHPQDFLKSPELAHDKPANAPRFAALASPESRGAPEQIGRPVSSSSGGDPSSVELASRARLRDGVAPPASRGAEPPRAPPASGDAGSAPEAHSSDPADAAGTDQIPPGEPGEPGETLVADAIVGDINGKPIYATEFFDELDARFRAEASRLPRNQFLARAQREIRRKLNELVERELLRAEAIASLPEEARRFGIQAFVRQISEGERRKYGGIRAGAERALGEDLEHYAREQTEQQLIQFQFQQAITDRLNISWREIQQEYERRYGEFNPDPVAEFRWIRVRASNTEDVRAIEEALASGMAFEEAASLPANGYEPDLGGLLSVSFKEPYEQASFLALDEVNEAARRLDPGESAGPIRSRGFVNWIELERIERRSTPLYDAQRVLEVQRRRALGQKELQRYIRRLKERASFTDIDEMTSRLLQIAADRYLPPPSGA